MPSVGLLERGGMAVARATSPLPGATASRPRSVSVIPCARRTPSVCHRHETGGRREVGSRRATPAGRVIPTPAVSPYCVRRFSVASPRKTSGPSPKRWYRGLRAETFPPSVSSSTGFSARATTRAKSPRPSSTSSRACRGPTMMTTTRPEPVLALFSRSRAVGDRRRCLTLVSGKDADYRLEAPRPILRLVRPSVRQLSRRVTGLDLAPRAVEIGL
jgi:hypothetical protein